MEPRNRKVGRRVGHLEKKVVVRGEVVDIETLNRLRPWMEDEARSVYGDFGKTFLRTDYIQGRDVYKFKLLI